MSQSQGGQGLGLPTAQYLYPTELNGTAYDISTNYQTLPAGESFVLPSGRWALDVGPYSFFQYRDPVTTAWRDFSTARTKMDFFWSDGANYRVANLTGCPVAAVVTNGGSGYVQASTTVVPATGSSTWLPIVGGMVSLSTISKAGSGYGIAPLLLIAAPPSPGVQATGYTVITGGSVTGVTLTNVGAGYPTAPTAVIVPSPVDPNLPTAPVQAVASFALIGSGTLAAVICTNSGSPVATAPSLTIAGVGTNASVTAVMCQTITAGSVSQGGNGFSGAGVTTFGGIPSATPVFTNPAIQLTGAIPRQAQLAMATTGGSLVSVSTIIDGGLFFGTPTVAVLGNGQNSAASLASVTVTLGSITDTFRIQLA